MNKKRRVFAFVLLAVTLCITVLSFKGVTAAENTNFKTTIINEDGLEIEVADIKSDEVVSTIDYIKANLDENYAKNVTAEIKDALYVKHLIADGTTFDGERTIYNLYYNGQEDSFIMMNDFATLLYDVDPESAYYVAIANTLYDDPNYYVADHCFAYTNLNGETVDDCIYDAQTGLVYVPKKYTAENKNTMGMNIQVELLQVANTANPVSTIDVKVNLAEDLEGSFATTGKASLEAIATEFGLRIALDDVARENITENFFKVYINGEETHAYRYYANEGILVVQSLPNTIETLEIDIRFDNVDDNVHYLMQNNGVSGYVSWEDIPVYAAVGEWVVTDVPAEGEAWYIDFTAEGEQEGFYAPMVDVYRAGAIHMGDSLPIYNEASDNNWVTIVDKIWHNGTININNLAHNGTWIQHELRFNEDVTSNGITIPGGTTVWLKCSHAETSFTASKDRGTDPIDGDPRYHAWKVRVRVLKVTDDYMIMGFLTSVLGGQAGTGIYKIAYTTGKGDLEVGKLNPYGEYVAGAKLRITGPNGFSREITTEAGKKTLIEDLEKGEYTVVELEAPTNMILNSQEVKVNVESNKTATAEITNAYQRGSVRLVKYDADHRGATLGDATLAGATYTLHAASDIYEGSTKVYTKDQVITTVTTNANGDTDAVGNLPIGSYYYKETNASAGFLLNTNNIPVSVTYAGQTSTVASSNVCECSEKPVYGNVQITKKLGALDYDPEINLAGVRFKATLKSNTNQVYYSTTSGVDGICTFTGIPYGTYTIEEYLTPPAAEKIANFDVVISENGKTYTYTKVDVSKDMKIEVFKKIKVNAGEKTDAVVQGAEFTVYRDAACTNKVCVIGPTDANGYAISGTMRTGTYYLKETKFPTGIDADATIPGENVTYRNKVYSVTYNNAAQGTEQVTVGLTVQNEPKRNDLEIFKEIGATSNTPEFPLDQCEFTATLKSSIGTDSVFSRKCTAQTTKEGFCIIEDLPYGEYVVEETKVSPISLKCDNFDIFIKEDQKVQTTPYYKNIVDEPKVMQLKIRKVDANRTDADAPDMTQGDGVLEGAIYQIFRYDPFTDDYTEAVYEITVDHKDEDGYWCAESQDLLVGNYMVKEKIAYTEEVDGKVYNYSYAEGYLADPETYYFIQNPAEQTVKRTFHTDTSKEEVIRGSVEVIKYDNIIGSTDDVASEGAILRLTLDSNPETYYDAVINAEGYAEFVEEKSREKYYPHTIPFGKYTITEIKESNKEEHTSFFIQPEGVTIEKNVQKEYRIEADEPVEMYLQVQKTDKDTGADVKLAGAKFKVWDCEKDTWVSQITYPSGAYIDEFTTNAEGNLTLPHKLEAGAYVVYETQAPAGYYLEEAWRLPENEADLGNAEVAGKYVLINKAAMGVVENTPSNSVDLYYKVSMPNEPLKGKLEIFKTGEMLTDSSVDSTDFGEKYTPVYNQLGLEGVTYDIIAAEDIKSPDGNVTYVAKGTKVDTITTGEDGLATTKELYLGEYEIVEVVTPEGYITDTDIENVVLENEDTLKRIEVTEKALNNIRQKLKLSFRKDYEEVNFANGTDNVRYAVFGVYTNQDIKNVEGRIVIEKDSLVDVITVEGDETDVTSTIDLPAGKYYVQELDCSYPYTMSEEIKEIELVHQGHTDEYVTYTMESFENTFEKATLALVKLSTSVMDDITLRGDTMDMTGLDAKVEQIIETLKSLTLTEAIDYINQGEIKTVAGATYRVYLDEECTEPLYLKVGEEMVEAELVTDESGLMILEDIPLGKYYVKETVAPVGYELAEEPVLVELTTLDKDSLVYRSLLEICISGQLISKTDIFTGEPVANCTFEIKDEDGEVLLHSVTDVEGKGYILTDLFEDGKTYTYTEIEAPEIYNLNNEPHEFVAKFDEEGNWITEKIAVDNFRKESTVTLEKLDFADSKPIPNCKFELKSLETDFSVSGVTDENGIYVFENIPYGKYTYQELEAPEEYILDTDPHEVTIDAEQMKIQVTNEKAPETGDIQVTVLASILVMSVAGIVFIMSKNKKLVK